MTASANIKTPSMDLPVKPGKKSRKHAKKLQRKFTKVTLAQVSYKFTFNGFSILNDVACLDDITDSVNYTLYHKRLYYSTQCTRPVIIYIIKWRMIVPIIVQVWSLFCKKSSLCFPKTKHTAWREINKCTHANKRKIGPTKFRISIGFACTYMYDHVLPICIGNKSLDVSAWQQWYSMICSYVLKISSSYKSVKSCQKNEFYPLCLSSS